MATENKFSKIFYKLQDILKRDSRTANFAVYGGQYSKMKQFPCVIIFPGDKDWITEEGQRTYRKTSLPKKVEYNFTIFMFVRLMELEDSYYSIDTADKAGITQVATEVEAVLKDNKTGTDLDDSTNILWSDIQWDSVKISPKYAKLMNATMQVKFVTKEIE
jgi:hypothetical protein